MAVWCAFDMSKQPHGPAIWLFCRFRSGSDGFTGGVRFCNCGLGEKVATGGNTEGVVDPRLPLGVIGLGVGGECFVGERPVMAGGRADA